VLLTIVPLPAGAQTSPDIEQSAVMALDRMGVYLRSLNAFQVSASTSLEEVLDSGQKIQLDSEAVIIAERPNHFRADVRSPRKDRLYFYDGKNFTLYARRMNYYATAPAPPTFRELIDGLGQKYGIDFPLSDLFLWGAQPADAQRIRAALDIGPADVLGTSCQHYAFREEGLDWQIWIQNGQYPLPRKLVLTTTSDPARPTYTSVLTWSLAPSFDSTAFTFVPPKDARKISFRDATATPAK
jgi:hypothetical protein